MEPTAAAAPVTENPYGLIALWNNGGPIAQTTLVILLIMSAVSWYIIFSKLWDQRRLKQGAKVVEKQFWSSGSLKEAVDRLPKDNDFRAVAEERRPQPQFCALPRTRLRSLAVRHGHQRPTRVPRGRRSCVGTRR